MQLPGFPGLFIIIRAREDVWTGISVLRLYLAPVAYSSLLLHGDNGVVFSESRRSQKIS